MQFIVISHQLWEIIASFLLGLVFGLLYDFVRFIRLLVPEIRFRKSLCNVLDLMYMTVFGASYCILLFALSSGRFRWFTALSLFIGLLLYRAMPSKLVMPLLSKVSHMIHGFVKLLFWPIVSFSSFLNSNITYFICKEKAKILIKRTDKIKKELYNTVKLM